MARSATALGSKRNNSRCRNSKKRKAETDAIHDLEDRCKRLKTDVSVPLWTSTELYEKCEKSGQLTLINKANAWCRMTEKKQQEIQALDKEIVFHLLAIKNKQSYRTILHLTCTW